jgi:hypothetical protein
MQTNDGGPAFPHTREQVATGMHGMTLRDYFAAAALHGWLASFPAHCVHPADPDHPNASRRDAMLSLHATCAYALADAMLAAREVKQ